MDGYIKAEVMAERWGVSLRQRKKLCKIAAVIFTLPIWRGAGYERRDTAR
ncbi:MAG: hypothetical protein LBH21_08015 [Gracilibacteraceae bacterium]|nr:hypothetical protein [Gracilibacteraceae bacterium]